jgi:hypothetical protein
LPLIFADLTDHPPRRAGIAAAATKKLFFFSLFRVVPVSFPWLQRMQCQ